MLNGQGFDAWANSYDRSVLQSNEKNRYPFAGYHRCLDGVYRRAAPGLGRRVLDLGFGTATLTKRLYDAGCCVTGLDFSAAMQAIAAEKMPRATLLVHDFSKGLPPVLDGERFDVIVSTYAFHHVSDEQKPALLSTLQARLAPKGQLLIGGVAFATARERERCRAEAGDEWDDDEAYVVWEELRREVPGLQFQQISFCAGILQLQIP